jgi:putative chitinase
MPVSVDQLKAIMPLTKRADEFTGPLNAAMTFIDVNTPLRQAMFLAQVAHESTQLNRLVENLNYSAAGLLATFPKRFDKAAAKTYERQPEKIANRAYASRLGNASEASGDGWKYRGRGLIQVTGKDNYQDCAKTLNVDLINSPAMLEMAEFAAQSAAWFWRKNSLNKFADSGDLVTCTERINGGQNGLDAREVYYEHAKSVLGA